MNMISTVGFFSLSYPFFQRKLGKKKRGKNSARKIIVHVAKKNYLQDFLRKEI